MAKPFNLSQHLTRNEINVLDHGAKGDGVTDDRAAIQAAIDEAGLGGGAGTVYLPQSKGGYRITGGLKLPSDVCLRGAAPVGYPYGGGNPNSSKIWADFADVNQWVIEPKTLNAGAPIAYNVECPDTATFTFNCAVRDLLIVGVNTVPYGGIRMHGCPGSIVENVGIAHVGTGLLVNYCFCGFYRANVLPLYVGVAAWSTNACKFEVHSAQDAAQPNVVPAGYLLPFMAALNGALVPTHGFNTNAHYNSPWGVVMGSTSSTAVNNRWDITSEHWKGGGVFSHFAYAVVVDGLYIEGPDITFGVAMSNTRLSSQSFHCYANASATHIFDFATNSMADIRLNGMVLGLNFFGPISQPGSNVILRSAKPGSFGHQNQWNLKWPDYDGDWIPIPFNAPAHDAGGVGVPATYRITRNNMVELRGYMAGAPGASFNFATLPPGFRCQDIQYHPSDATAVVVQWDGNLAVNTAAPNTSLNGLSWQQVN